MYDVLILSLSSSNLIYNFICYILKLHGISLIFFPNTQFYLFFSPLFFSPPVHPILLLSFLFLFILFFQPIQLTYIFPFFLFFVLFCFFFCFFVFFNASLITSPSNCPPFLLPWVSLTVWVWSGDVGTQDGDCGLGIWGCGCGVGVWWLWYFLASGWYFMAVCSIFERQALWWWWDRVCVSWGLGGESVLWMLLWWDG